MKENIFKSEEAVVSVFVAITFVGILAIFNLLSDGAEIRNGRRSLTDLVAQAARAAAQEIDIEEIKNTGQLQLDTTKARSRATSIIESRYKDIIIEVEVLRDKVSVSGKRTIELWGNRTIEISAKHIAQSTINLPLPFT